MTNDQVSATLIALLLACGMHLRCQLEDTVTEARTNVIIVMTDDQGYGDLACHGNPHIKTPNLDRLYEQSVRLTNFHVGTTCSPTRASLLSGKYCNRVGVWHTIAGRSQLAAEEMTMGNIFQDNGYRTKMIGKWHLGDSYPFRPEDRGFDEVFAHGGGGVGQMPDYWDNDYFGDTYFRNGVPEKTQGYCTDVWFDEALSFLEKNQDSTFFLYLATNAPHGPFHVDSSYIKPYLGNDEVANANFLGMITNFDENLGRLTNKLKNLNLDDNTILIFLTDNGTARGVRFDENGAVTHGYNAGMRGIKGSQYEGGHRVPCFIRMPANNARTAVDINTLTAHVDLAPTLIDMLDLHSTTKFDGTSLKPLLTTENVPASFNQRILITDTQRREFPVKWQRSATMMEHWRLINGEDLYDVAEDPGQKNNLAEAHADLVDDLRGAYEKWWAEIEPGFSKYTRAELGSSANKKTTLYSHDWHHTENAQGEPNLNPDGSHGTPWHQRHIRQGQLINGTWMIDVAESGNYLIEMRRWPEESNTPLNAGLPSKAAVSGGTPDPEGEMIEIKDARLEVGSQELTKSVMQGSSFVQFEISLEKGPTNLKATFRGPDGVNLGAYFVTAWRT